ncbi:glycolipid transfer protein domain-containing protein [Cantharellus anzutake]|uniref:glycolipid transfer protein domain-containing protein n=1 Tax=Cantharellus anzutake TaxID=1750568 RepID=UPI001908572C|nr:glycolipid transfer protein domain-containing protein [Cantharellus anzutake]KAF8326849.1 glycolipid transfer protein domain-containing protein [Cantharellus anzutake]
MSENVFFNTLAKSFTDVTITDAGVDTIAFLEASEGIVQLFNLLGSAAFAPVKADISGNITKVRTRYLAAPTISATLESLVENEKGEKKRTATEGLLWLLRGLQFTCIALQRSVADKKEELSISFTKAYEDTLKKFHNFVVRPIFALAMKACPSRADFYPKLGSPPDKVETELIAWLAALDKIVKRVQEFYVKGGHDKGL